MAFPACVFTLAARDAMILTLFYGRYAPHYLRGQAFSPGRKGGAELGDFVSAWVRYPAASAVPITAATLARAVMRASNFNAVPWEELCVAYAHGSFLLDPDRSAAQHILILLTTDNVDYVPLFQHSILSRTRTS